MMMMAMPSSSWRCLVSSRTWAWTVTSRAVVGSSAISSDGSQGQGHGDHGPLAHAPGELVGVIVDALGRHGVCPPGRAAPPPCCGPAAFGDLLVRADRLDDLPADPVVGVQAGERVLEDHADLLAPDRSAAAARLAVNRSWPSNSAWPEMRAPRGQAHHRLGGDALARARLAHDPERLTPLDAEAHALTACTSPSEVGKETVDPLPLTAIRLVLSTQRRLPAPFEAPGAAPPSTGSLYELSHTLVRS